MVMFQPKVRSVASCADVSVTLPVHGEVHDVPSEIEAVLLVIVEPAAAFANTMAVIADAGAVPMVMVQSTVVPLLRLKLAVAVAFVGVAGAGVTLALISTASHSDTGSVIVSGPGQPIPTTATAASTACNLDVRIAIPPVFPNWLMLAS